MTNFFGGGQAKSQKQPPASSLRIQQSAAGVMRSIGYGQTRTAGNLFWYNDFEALQVASPGAQGGKGLGQSGGGKGASDSGQYDYRAAVMIGLGEGPIDSVLNVWNNKTKQSLASLNLVYGTGAYNAAPWGYLSSNHPEQALNYRGLAWVAGGKFDMGSNPELPNLTFEVRYALNSAIPGQPDADPSAVIKDLLTNQFYGLGFPSASIAALDTYSSYCRASGLVISPILATQAEANNFLSDLMLATNSEFVWSGKTLNVVPYGDTALSANGATYTPPAAPLYYLTDTDYLSNQGGGGDGSGADDVDPVVATVKAPRTQINDIQIEFFDRTNDYNPAVAEAKDDAAIQDYGLKSNGLKQLHMFCLASAALLSAQLQLGRQQIRTQYSFTVGPEYILLDPMDIIAISDSNLGLNEQWVRIVEMTENDDRSLSILAEDYLAGSASSPGYDQEGNSGYVPDYNVDPGDVNAPLVFGLPAVIADNQGLTLGCAVSGSNALWGGCNVHVSTDGDTYRLIGQQRGPARMGVTTADFLAGSDPDRVHSLNVDLSQSNASLLSGTQADADDDNTLCLVRSATGDEYVSYQTATLISDHQYALQDYLRRGQYKTNIIDHPAGSSFARIDSNIFQIPYTADMVGKTLHLKFTSFNVWEGGEKDLASVTDYVITVPAPPLPPDVQGFAAKQNGNVVAFGWDHVDDAGALKGYDIGYAAQGVVDWALFKMLTEAAAGTEMTNAEVPPGNWTFGIRARDIADQLSPDIAMLDLQVTATNPIIYDAPEEKAWTGALNGFVLHYTGVLVPENSLHPSDYSDSVDNGYTDIDNFVNDPVATCEYTTNAIDTGIDDDLRVFMEDVMVVGPGETGTPDPALLIDTWLTGQTDPDTFVPWTIGFVQMRYLRERISYNPVAGQVAYLTSFTPSVDISSPVEQDLSETIPAGGKIVTFPKPFHFPPSVVPTVVSDQPLYATAVNVTSTQCEVHVWNSSGTDVGGDVSIIVKGE